MRKTIIACAVLLVLLSACTIGSVPEPERCALCDGLARHAPCIINLNTGEKLELDIYEPHPFLVGEIAEEQRGGYFSFVRGAGVEGYKLGAESVTITIPVKADTLDQRHFCNACRELLNGFEKDGYVLADLKNIDQPVLYSIEDGTSFSVRCYDVTVKILSEENKYEINIIRTYSPDNEAKK